MKIKNGIEIDCHIEGNNNKLNKKKKRTFISRRKYQKLKKNLARKRNLTLVYNYSDFNLTPAMDNLLNRGVGFAPTPHHINKTGLKAHPHL